MKDVQIQTRNTYFIPIVKQENNFLQKDFVIFDIHFSFHKMIGICYNHCPLELMQYKTEMLLSDCPTFTSLLFDTENHTSVALTKG